MLLQFSPPRYEVRAFFDVAVLVFDLQGHPIGFPVFPLSSFFSWECSHGLDPPKAKAYAGLAY